MLYSGASSVVELLGLARDHISRAASMDRALDSLLESLDDISAGVEDISMALRAKTAAYEYDPAAIEALEEKLHFIQDLKRKHRTDEQGLIDLKTELESRLALAEDSNEAIRQPERPSHRQRPSMRNS